MWCGGCDAVGARVGAAQRILNDTRPAVLFWDLAEQPTEGYRRLYGFCYMGAAPFLYVALVLCCECAADPRRPPRPQPRAGGGEGAPAAADSSGSAVRVGASESAGWVGSARDGLWYAGQRKHMFGDCTLSMPGGYGRCGHAYFCGRGGGGGGYSGGYSSGYGEYGAGYAYGSGDCDGGD
jgi:hypothetical protein